VHYKIKIDVNGPSANNAYITIDSGSTYSNDYVLNLEWDNFVDIDGSGIVGYYYSFTNKGGTADGTWTTSPSGILTATWEGETTVYVWAKDNVGNIGPAASALIIIQLPTVIGLELSTKTVYRTQTITFTSNCNDPCDAENRLDCQIQYKIEDGIWQDLTPTYITAFGGCWQAVFTPTIDAELGTYHVRVKYTNLNGTTTDWTTESFTVLNNPPRVVNPITDFEILEDHVDSTTVNLNTVFSDVETLNLEYSVSGNVHITVNIIPDGSVEFIPEANWSGTETITFSASDGTAPSTLEEVKVTITPVNDLPIAIIDSQFTTSILGEKLTITGHGVDVDGTIIDYNWTSDIDGQLSITSNFDTPTLSHGEHIISFSVQDSDSAWSKPVTINFKVTAPNLVIEDVKLSTEDITEGDTITIIVTINNDGDANATNITVIFYDGDKKIGSKKLEVIESNSSKEVSLDWQPDLGEHSIRVVAITEDEGIIESDADNNQLAKSFTAKLNWTPWIILIIIIIIIIIIILFFILRARKLKQKDLETISEMEAQLEQAKKLGLPTKELERLLEEAKGLRKI